MVVYGRAGYRLPKNNSGQGRVRLPKFLQGRLKGATFPYLAALYIQGSSVYVLNYYGKKFIFLIAYVEKNVLIYIYIIEKCVLNKYFHLSNKDVI